MTCQQCGATLPENSPFCSSCGARVLRAAANDPLLGRTFLNQYILRKKLGQGGYGSVYEADQPSISRKAAVKVLHPHLSNQPEIAIRFRREGLAASKLTHPAVVKIYNFGETEDGVIWIAMEFLEGEDLGTRLRRAGPVSSRELLLILGPICEALQEAHQKGIVHRDLKPDNIMLTKGPSGEVTPKLLDFGVAALVDDLQVTQSGALSGSPPYMPPEQWKGLKYTDARSDIYALGVVAYQCLTNHLPFDADTAPAWMQKHCTEPPLDMTLFVNDQIPKATQSVIQKALLKDPNERFQTTLEFKKALEDAERGVSQVLPLAATQPHLSLPPKEAPKGSNLKLIIGVALGALAAFGVTLLLQPPAALPPAPATTPVIEKASPATVALETPKTQTSPGDTISNVPEKPQPRTMPAPPTSAPKKPPKPKPAAPPTPPAPKLTNSDAGRLILKSLQTQDFSFCHNPDSPMAAVASLSIDKDGKVFKAFPGTQEPQSKCLAGAIEGRMFPQYATGEGYSMVFQLFIQKKF